VPFPRVSWIPLWVTKFYNPKAIRAFVRSRKISNQSHAIQIELPSRFVGREYQDLFRDLISQHMICLGLYRAPLPERAAVLPYVFTNPPPETILDVQDRVFVLTNG